MEDQNIGRIDTKSFNLILRDSEPFDWYQRYQNIKEHICNQINPDSKILNIGAGTSSFIIILEVSEEMFDEGYQNIINIDFSPQLIKIMQEKHRQKMPLFKYLKMDCQNMSEFDDGQFDCVIDKGTLDTLYCTENAIANVNKAVSEIYRVLQPKGVFICISHQQPENRLSELEQVIFQPSHNLIGKFNIFLLTSLLFVLIILLQQVIKNRQIYIQSIFAEKQLLNQKNEKDNNDQ